MLLGVSNQKYHSPPIARTMINIDTSTNDGINLFEYFKSKTGRVPRTDEAVVFLVQPGVSVVAASTNTPAMTQGFGWGEASDILIENRGNILGRGGKGGRSAGPNWPHYQVSYNSVFYYSTANGVQLKEVGLKPAVAGGNGGTAISGIKITVDNYGIIAGGGGGGGGSSAHYLRSSPALAGDIVLDGYNGDMLTVGAYWGLAEAGTGGGAPYGLSNPNVASPRYTKRLLKNKLSSYMPPLTASDFVVTIIIRQRDPRINGINFEVEPTWHNRYTNLPYPQSAMLGYKPAYINHILNTDLDMGELGNVVSPIAAYYLPHWLDHSTDDIYYPISTWGYSYGVRKDSVTYATMVEDSPIFKSTDSKDGSLLQGGAGGYNGTAAGLTTGGNVDYRAFSPPKVWRYKYAITNMPSNASLITYKQWYGLESNITAAPKYADSTYVKPIDHTTPHGGAGGDVGENGKDGLRIPQYIVILSNSDYMASEDHARSVRVVEYSPSMFPATKGVMLETPAAIGGLAGYIKEGGVTINNQPGGITKGR